MPIEAFLRTFYFKSIAFFFFFVFFYFICATLIVTNVKFFSFFLILIFLFSKLILTVFALPQLSPLPPLYPSPHQTNITVLVARKFLHIFYTRCHFSKFQSCLFLYAWKIVSELNFRDLEIHRFLSFCRKNQDNFVIFFLFFFFKFFRVKIIYLEL